jgi:hypothetical protein
MAEKQKLIEYIKKVIVEVLAEDYINVVGPEIEINVTGQLTYYPPEKWKFGGGGWYLELVKEGSTLPIGKADAYPIPPDLVKEMGLDSIKDGE